MDHHEGSRVSPIEVPIDPTVGADPVYVSDRVAALLGDLGYTYLPLNPGSSFRGLHDSIVQFRANVDPKVLLCLHEEIAVSVAHGYAKATGRPSAVAVHDLVGLQHASMAVFNAWADGTPMLILGGSGPELPRERRSLDWTHSASTQADVVKAIVKWTANPIDESGTLEAIAQAHRLSRSAPTGPTYVTVDAEVQERAADATPYSLPEVRPLPALEAGAGEIDRAARLLVAARSPLVCAGRVGLRAEVTEPLVALVELLGAAYQDDRSFVSFPTDHPLNCNGDAVAAESDVILAVDVVDPGNLMGVYAGERGGRPAPSGAALIDLSTNSLAASSWSYMGNAAIPRAVELVADPVAGLRQLLAAVGRIVDAGEDPFREERVARARAVRERHELAASRDNDLLAQHFADRPISSYRLVHDVYEAVKDEEWILALRNTRSFPVQVWKFSGGGQYMGHSGGSGVGYGPGAAVGIALAARDAGKFAVGIIGDGDLVMAAGALWTAVHYRIPLLLVVNNNCSFYNDERHQEHMAKVRGRELANAWIGTRYEDPAVDFATIARGYGAWGFGPVEDPRDLEGALSAATREVRAGGVALVDVRTAR